LDSFLDAWQLFELRLGANWFIELNKVCQLFDAPSFVVHVVMGNITQALNYALKMLSKWIESELNQCGMEF
jgi:hypothetical protein